jgi:hypothetical protein
VSLQRERGTSSVSSCSQRNENMNNEIGWFVSLKKVWVPLVLGCFHVREEEGNVNNWFLHSLGINLCFHFHIISPNIYS